MFFSSRIVNGLLVYLTPYYLSLLRGKVQIYELCIGDYFNLVPFSFYIVENIRYSLSPLLHWLLSLRIHVAMEGDGQGFPYVYPGINHGFFELYPLRTVQVRLC